MLVSVRNINSCVAWHRRLYPKPLVNSHLTNSILRLSCKCHLSLWAIDPTAFGEMSGIGNIFRSTYKQLIIRYGAVNGDDWCSQLTVVSLQFPYSTACYYIIFGNFRKNSIRYLIKWVILSDSSNDCKYRNTCHDKVHG